MIAKLDDLKNYAELAQASYFYFDLDGYVLKENNITITLNEIISSNYNGKTAGKKIKIGHEYYLTDTRELNGEFGELQAKEFIKRYKIYFHQANTVSGFSATLFYDTQKDRFVLGFRGTEGFWNIDAIQDIALSLSMNIQYSALLDFLKKVDKIIHHYNKPIIFVGHSLGGYLAQIALLYCDYKHKDLLEFSPKEVYTFNSPSIYGWNFPNTIINPNTIKILREVFNKLSIDTSMKLTHIYNSSGIKLIASAQYGSQNTLPIYTGLNSHSIIPLTQTLYFYSYLLELKDNYNKIAQNNTLQDTINNLNAFMLNIQTYLSAFVTKTNKMNTQNFTRKNGPLTLIKQRPQEINFLALFLSKIAVMMSERKRELNNYNENYLQTSIQNEQIIDFILKMQEKQKYILILNKNDINKLRKDCTFINDKENIAYKVAIDNFRIFVAVDKNGKCLENADNISQIYGYNLSTYSSLNQIWEEQCLGGKCKIIQGLYFGGKTKVFIAS